jgi:hypothetical protein
MTNLQFYQNCAIAAMQGLQESTSKLGTALDFIPDELAKKAFDIADHMMTEYHKRLAEKTYLKTERGKKNA